jgi:hypothetical protein
MQNEQPDSLRRDPGFPCPKCGFFIRVDDLPEIKQIVCPGCATHFILDRNGEPDFTV